MRNATELARNIVRVWMRDVLEKKRWSANEWASIAGTSPTNITRMLAPTSKIVPSVETVMKLAQAAGSQPNLIPGVPKQAQDYPCNFCPDCGHDLRGITRPPQQERA